MRVTKSDFDFSEKNERTQKWPIVGMAVGEKVAIHDLEDTNKACRYVHNIGSQYGRKFKTRTVDGVLHVMRIK